MALVATATMAQTKTAYAVFCDGDNILYFLNSAETLTEGDTFTYGGVTKQITNLWQGTQVTATGGNYPEWKSSISTSVERVVFDESFKEVKPTSFYCWFQGFTSLSSIDGLKNLDTSEATKMASMFKNCSALTSLDLSSFDTGKVQFMDDMFRYCSALTSLDIRNFCISYYSPNIFGGCYKLKKLDMSNATGNVERLFIYDEIPAGRGMMISMPESFNVSGASEENYIVKTTGTSFVRTFTAGNMSTICLPYAVDASAVTGGTLYEYAGVDTENNAVKFTSVTGSTEPNTAYLFKPSTGEKVIFTGADAMTGLPADIEEGAAPGLYGTYTTKTFTGDEATAGIYFGWSEGSFWRAGEGASVKPNRAYLKISAGTNAARLSVRLDNETTGIGGIATADNDTAAPAYNLSGQRVTDGYKGIVIKNGRKVIAVKR